MRDPRSSTLLRRETFQVKSAPSSLELPPGNKSKPQQGSLPLLASVLMIPIALGSYVYSFGLYAHELKESLDLTQAELTTLSTAIFCAGVLQWIPGIVIDRYGERFSMLLGGQVGCGAMILYWGIARKYMVIQPGWLLVPTLCLLTVLIYLSEALLYGSVFNIVVKVCQHSRGAIVGVVKGQVGLGTGVFVVLFQCLQREHNLDFLLLMAVFFLGFGAILPYFTVPRVIESDQTDPLTKPHIYLIYLSMFLCAAQALVHTLWALYTGKSEDEDGEKRQVDYLRFAFVMIGWVGPIAGTLFLRKAEPTHMRVPTSESLDKDDKETQSSYSLPQMLRTFPGWLLIWTLIMLAGAGVTLTQNMGQMVQALQLDHKTVTPAGLTIFSVANAASRVVTGAFSGSGCPRPLLLLRAAVAATIAHALLAVSWSEFEFLGAILLTGIAYGMYHPLIILVVGDLFGPKYLASNFLFMDGISLAGGSVLLNKIVSQHVYEAHLQEGSATCIGEGCFGVTHWITCGLCVTAMLTSVWLLLTKLSRQSYSKVLMELEKSLGINNGSNS
jgi:hypothetical protein